MSHDHQLDKIMDWDIAPDGNPVDIGEAVYGAKYLNKPGTEMHRLSEFEEATVDFKHNEGSKTTIQGVEATIKECRAYRAGNRIVTRYLVENETGQMAEIGDNEIIEEAKAPYQKALDTALYAKNKAEEISGPIFAEISKGIITGTTTQVSRATLKMTQVAKELSNAAKMINKLIG